MNKPTRDELIAALVTDKFSGFKAGDEAQLQVVSDARLEEFRTASETNSKQAETLAKMETDARQMAARLKVAEERIVKLELPISDADFVARLAADSPIKAVLEARAAEETQLKASLISSLKDLGGETEEQLKKKTIPELQTLAKYAGVKVLDFSGRGVAVERAAGDGTRETYAPPDPYKAGIEKLRLASAKR